MKKIIILFISFLIISNACAEIDMKAKNSPITLEDEQFLDTFILDFINKDTITWDVKIPSGDNGEYRIQTITGLFYAKKGMNENNDTFYLINFFYTLTLYNKFDTPLESGAHYQSVLFSFHNKELFDWFPFKGEKIKDINIKLEV